MNHLDKNAVFNSYDFDADDNGFDLAWGIDESVFLAAVRVDGKVYFDKINFEIDYPDYSWEDLEQTVKDWADDRYLSAAELDYQRRMGFDD